VNITKFAEYAKSALTAVLLAAVAAGCVPSEPISEEHLDRYWYLHASRWETAAVKPITLGPRRLPSKWVLRQEPSLIWSTVSIVRAVDRLKGEADPGQTIEIGIHSAHAQMIDEVLEEVRGALEDLRAMLDPDSPSRRGERWSTLVAKALVTTEKVVRLTEAADGASASGAGAPEGDAFGWTAGPLLEMLSGYLNDRAGGALLDDLDKADVKQLRVVLTQVLLRLSFAAAGKQDPPDLRAAVVEKLTQPDRTPEQIRDELDELLARALDEAPAAATGARLGRILNGALKWAPTLIEVLQSFLRDWDRMDSLTVEIRRLADKPVLALTFQVRPGQELRLAELFFMQPAIVFTGQCRVLVQPKLDAGEATAVLFEPVGDGGAEIRFDGLGYGLVRLLAVPLDSARLREVRVWSSDASLGRKMLSVSLILEVPGKADPRRMFSFRRIRHVRHVRGPFAVRKQTDLSVQLFDYITPDRRYFYRRDRTGKSE